MSKGNGHDKDTPKNIVSFPDASERKKLKKDEEQAIREQYRRERKAQKSAQSQPFFNAGQILPFSASVFVVIIGIHILISLFFDSGARLALTYHLGFIPGAFTGGFEASFLKFITPLSYIFIHGGWFHALVNAAMGFVLGLFLERIYGTRAAILFFILCCLGGALFYFIADSFSKVPVIGASGGISGLFAAVLVVMLEQMQRQSSHYSSASIMNGQNAAIRRVASFVKRKGPWPILIFWGVLMGLFGLLSGDHVSVSTHLGGYVAGIFLILGLQKGKIKL